jgi:hypothetical protein
MINKIASFSLFFLCIQNLDSNESQMLNWNEEYGFDEKKIINIFDYPKLYFNKLFYCQPENEKTRTYKFDLFKEEITLIIYYPKFTRMNVTYVMDMIDFDEGKLISRFKEDNGTPDKSKLNKWSLNKDALTASYIAYDSFNAELYENDWIGPYELKCYQELPPSLREFK